MPLSRFLTSQICLLPLFANIRFSRKIPNLQYLCVYIYSEDYCESVQMSVALHFIFAVIHFFIKVDFQNSMSIQTTCVQNVILRCFVSLFVCK